MAAPGLRIDGIRFRDSENREITFRGINVAGDCKFPRYPDQPSHQLNGFFDADNVSFVGRPFTEEEAHVHFARLKRWGYNVIRYIFTWEALEHAGPGVYDEDFIDHTIKILRIAKSYGFYIFMDPHQDVWSRFTGGSGAPLWTLHACGLDPERFTANQAAVVHNTWPEPAKFPKMLWPTNYTRLATQVTFTLFFAGRDFAPNAIIDGKNIQDYLTDHFVDACAHLAQRIHDAGGLENECIIGWETMNEPHRGLVGWEDLDELPDDLKMRKGTCPTPWQAILTGSGRAVEIDVYDFNTFGPYKSGKELVDPEGVSAWLPKDFDDSKYGWKRDPGWKLGECLWAQNGVWDPSQDLLLKKDYFASLPKSGDKLDYVKFTNLYYMHHFRKYRDAIRSVHKNCMILMQSAVLEIPPLIKDTADDEKRLIFASHYYDGLTLIQKHWNKYYNVDIFGLLRHRYSSPAFAVRLGQTAIRNCLRDQLRAIRDEGLENLGEHPTLFTEIGIPFDMDDKYAYKTGDYSSQTSALDANHYALEGSGAQGYTLWTYVGQNNHEYGDLWNGEDLSIVSVDDPLLPPSSSMSRLKDPNQSTSSLGQGSDGYSGVTLSSSTVNPSNIKDVLRQPEIAQKPSSAGSYSSSNPGLRAAEAYVRPSPIATVGDVVNYGFDLAKVTFTFSLVADRATKEDVPTEIYLPEFHFPVGKTNVDVSGGRWRIDAVDVDGESMQVMKWWHGVGEQTMTVKGVKRKPGALEEEAETEAGYIDTMKSSMENCSVM
ncbi:glycoside hydrolase superfamily [Exophiala viscosa]|uniref:glycoside hydrolase superfamily n=1 Tax=Exophiala viscosa TaxID=2486360 RepID=UPI00218CF608|nr:glycoside hydrolase superfamily [Exophiala viscosa]